MRIARVKVSGCGAFYHLYNRICGPKDDYPFDAIDKETAWEILFSIILYFRIEVISFTMMDNHYHLVVYAPCDMPDNGYIANRHNQYYDGRKPHISLDNDESCQKTLIQMNDISEFIKIFQMMFTRAYNKRHNRRGSLWADRFKCTILQGDGIRSAVWDCVKYVEMNPVRAGLVDHPSNYRFCSWGRFKGTGEHPFKQNFIKHMRLTMGEKAQYLTDLELFVEFEVVLAQRIANEKTDDEYEIKDAVKAARRGEAMQLKLLQRTRYYTDGLVIGSKAFIEKIMSSYKTNEELARRQFSYSREHDIYCYKRLRKIE